ncbi:MAG: helix-turn-helix domain-containing protein [Burkholderiales bacterium]
MHDFTVLVLPGALATTVAASVDVLYTAAFLAPRLGVGRPTWRVVSPAGPSVPLSGGLHVDALPLPQRPRAADSSLWIVPGLGVDRPADLPQRLQQADAQRAVAALARHAQRGGEVAASCSAVFLLQAARLLAGRRVTTAWWLAGALRKLAPDCTVDADRMVCADGPVSTAGAAFAMTDLMLHLLRARFGAPLADAVGRVLVIDGRQAQAPFVLPPLAATGGVLVARLTEHIEAALPKPPSVEALAAQFAMSSRTLARHVKAATGQSPLALVQSVRLNRARMLIETSRLSIDQVAAQVGYEDATALRRLMRKVAGANPSRFRPSSFRQ